ncbi:tRNA(Ile)(2)-agmatinylcytidine synthase [Halodesulfurarchaeum sp. HSR-GB]|uniref:tRNA(Ile)(2)-agmatinylcytidine synthase n=1 Tax=Halodesulfurarchaeum sp. HSR-GB TaxID=3074077 RepID=UPI002856455A|nr:tRNA(Ile)(2)-agmatinylcytidine synthase [Halodesulfurarchaeum sp. HSR-GB]MDR5656339.1 tRNA(Ile)(2)-agmatinylcytidine synthase [Halodesulfurarchaeum sp. HSR-GB]
MTVLGLDDTDSRERGMCTTYVATRVAQRLRRAGARIDRLRLIRLNPAVEHKTRGNAALAIHTDAAPDLALATAREVIDGLAELEDERTHPGVVVAEEPIDQAVQQFGRRAIREVLDRETAIDRIEAAGYSHAGWKQARGTIGALAAIGVSAAFEGWTYEYIAYRDPGRWGTERSIEIDSVFDAADQFYPTAWDTVDRGEGEPVCVPNAPGPILYGIRGDEPNAVAALAAGIESEPVHAQALFETNQGTDSHLRDAAIGGIEDGRAYRVTGRVIESPETRAGGHVFTAIADGTDRLPCVAFEPTKRFRDRVRALRVGDRITVAGEVTDGTLKLEKFAVRDLIRQRAVTPTCPDCGRRMESAGADQGYRCRDCNTSTDSKELALIERDLSRGWYEVPPCARRHIAKPLVRGGFDAPTHPER